MQLMAGKIPQAFIDDLLDRIDIVDVIGGRVDLRKSGKNHKACCPFHDEKTPSFSVNQDKQFYYCFGCGAGGNALGFIMDYDRIEFPQAVELLAHQAGLEVPREASSVARISDRRDPIYQILEKADRFYRNQLRSHRSAGEAVAYLKQRGLSGEIAKDFGIGLAPPGWDNLLTHLARSDKDLSLLVSAGMVIEREDSSGHYDRFRHRIVFPIRDTRGRVVGFGGRVLGDEQPKYLNSPETPVFSKSRELYGLYEARSQVRDLDTLVVVEGYMDVVALAQFGIHNAVATLGTAITEQHLHKLYRYTSNIVFCFDGDDAGRKAAHRALETCLPAMQDGYSARFLFLPDGEDPDTLVRSIGCYAFKQQIAEAMPLSEYLFAQAREDLDLTTPDDRARLSQRAAPLINTVPESVFRELLLGKLAELTELDKETLSTLIQKEEPKLRTGSSSKEGSTSEPRATGKPSSINSADLPPLDAYADEPYHRTSNQNLDDIRGRREFSSTHTLRQYPTRSATPPLHRLLALLMTKPQLCIELETELVALKNEIDSTTESKLEHQGDEASDTSQSSANTAIKLRADTALLYKIHDLIIVNPHYTLNHILGYWRGVYGQEEGELLARIAASDLQASHKDAPVNHLAEARDIIKHLVHQIEHSQPIEKRLSRFLQQCTSNQELDSPYRSRLASLILELAQLHPEHPLIEEAKQKLEHH